MRREKMRERDLRIYQLRQRGWSLRRIAQEVGMSAPSSVHGALARARSEFARPAAEYQRDLAADHLDQLSSQAWSVVDDPGPTVSAGRLVLGMEGRSIRDRRLLLEALRIIVMIEERRAKLLGLDAPKRTAVTVITDDDLDREIDRLTAEIQAREAALPKVIEAGSRGDHGGA